MFVELDPFRFLRIAFFDGQDFCGSDILSMSSGISVFSILNLVLAF